MATPLTLLAVILHFCAAAATVEALVFDVPSGSSKCLTEELRRFAHSRASYRVAAESTSAADPRISARVTGPRGEELHLAEAAERGGAQVPGGGGRRAHRLLLDAALRARRRCLRRRAVGHHRCPAPGVPRRPSRTAALLYVP